MADFLTCVANFMDLQLKAKVVLVTGGAKGIGAAIVRACAEEGAIPVIVDRDADSAGKLQDELRGKGTTIHTVTAELSSAEDCAQAVAQTKRTCGRLDALVNNAGVNDKVGLEHGSPSDFVASLEHNLVHYY